MTRNCHDCYQGSHCFHELSYFHLGKIQNSFFLFFIVRIHERIAFVFFFFNSMIALSKKKIGFCSNGNLIELSIV